MFEKKYGFVMLYRSIINWQWYLEPNTFRLFIHCLVCANHKEKKWQGITIPAGSFVTSIPKLAKDLNLTKRQIQTALKHLILSCDVLYKPSSRYSIISIKNYDSFQSNVPQGVTQMFRKCSTDVPPMYTTNKEYKEDKEKNEYNNRIKKIFQKLSEEESKSKENLCK